MPLPDAGRRLPRGDEVYLDHIAHFVADAEAARAGLARAGFRPAPLAIQQQKDAGVIRPTGTGNMTAMLQNGYIEVLFQTADTALGRELTSARARYTGVHLVAFAVAQARAHHTRLAQAGFRVRPLVELKRPVETETGPAEAAFTVARVEPGQMAEGRIQFLTHHTEDTVWQKRWLVHDNGANRLLDVVIAVPDVAEAAARYACFLDRPAVRTRIGLAVVLDRGTVQLVTDDAFHALVPGDWPKPPFIGLYAMGVGSLDTAQRIFVRSGVRHERQGNALLADFPPELGQGAWMFAERASDLPWRKT